MNKLMIEAADRVGEVLAVDHPTCWKDGQLIAWQSECPKDVRIHGLKLQLASRDEYIKELREEIELLESKLLQLQGISDD